MTLNFMLNEMPVGFFKGQQYPRADGHYHYEPYRGAGHYQMAMALHAGRTIECYYDTADERVTFTVAAIIGYGLLDLVGFRRHKR